MRFFKYLIFFTLTFISFNSHSAVLWKAQGAGFTVSSYSPSEACQLLYNKVYPSGSSWLNNGPDQSNKACTLRTQSGSGAVLGDLSQTQQDCSATSVSSDPISVPGWQNWTLDQSDAYAAKIAGKTACYQGCRYKNPSMGNSGNSSDSMHLTFGDPVLDSSCPMTDTKPSTPVPDGTPTQPTQCKNANGSDAYCDKPPTGCPSGYKEGMFNNKQICVKNSPDPDPTKPNPNDPNNGDGNGSCNGTNNCNTTNFDDSGIISAINSLKSSLTSAISSMTNTLSSAISSVTSAVNSVKNSVDSNTAAVNANGDKVKSAVDSNTAAVNTTGDKVKNSVDSNTAAVNANGDKVKNSVDSNTAAVNANGDKVKNSVDANTAAVNANGDKVKNSVDANTAAVKEGNGLLSDIKNWLTSTDGVKGDPGLLTIDQLQIEQQQDKFNWSAQCPAPIEKTTSIIGFSWTYSFSFDSLCTVLARLSNYFVFSAFLAACFIIAGVRNG